LTTSCSLLHVPFTTANEDFEPAILDHFAFAVEKLGEYSLRLSVLVKMLSFVLVLQV